MIEDDQQHSSFWDNSSDDEADWEEVAVPTAPDMQPEPDDVPYDPYGPSVGTLQPSDAENIEITIQTRPKAEEGMKCVDLLSGTLQSQLTHSGQEEGPKSYRTHATY